MYTKNVPCYTSNIPVICDKCIKTCVVQVPNYRVLYKSAMVTVTYSFGRIFSSFDTIPAWHIQTHAKHVILTYYLPTPEIHTHTLSSPSTCLGPSVHAQYILKYFCYYSRTYTRQIRVLADDERMGEKLLIHFSIWKLMYASNDCPMVINDQGNILDSCVFVRVIVKGKNHCDDSLKQWND